MVVKVVQHLLGVAKNHCTDAVTLRRDFLEQKMHESHELGAHVLNFIDDEKREVVHMPQRLSFRRPVVDGGGDISVGVTGFARDGGRQSVKCEGLYAPTGVDVHLCQVVLGGITEGTIVHDQYNGDVFGTLPDQLVGYSGLAGSGHRRDTHVVILPNIIYHILLFHGDGYVDHCCVGRSMPRYGIEIYTFNSIYSNGSSLT